VNKFRSKRTECRQGHTHDSAKEARRCNDLTLLERAGEISGLKIQRPYDIRVNGQKITRYIADFSYWEEGKEIVEDVKSEATRKLPVYRLKRKLMAAIHGIEVRET
jgi:hypothetical protein